MGRRSAGSEPSRRATSAANAGLDGARAPSARVVSARENRTPPVVERTATSSATDRTAAKPTPKRPTGDVAPRASRLADARNEARDVTPSASSGTPVFAATSTAWPSTVLSRSSRWPGTPPRVAASAAFCASSTTTRSR